MFHVKHKKGWQSNTKQQNERARKDKGGGGGVGAQGGVQRVNARVAGGVTAKSQCAEAALIKSRGPLLCEGKTRVINLTCIKDYTILFHVKQAI